MVANVTTTAEQGVSRETACDHGVFALQNRTDLGSRYPDGNERVVMTERLTRILTAYAYSDPQVGYCQGRMPHGNL